MFAMLKLVTFGQFLNEERKGDRRISHGNGGSSIEPGERMGILQALSRLRGSNSGSRTPKQLSTMLRRVLGQIS
jgi:hypothetical protein